MSQSSGFRLTVLVALFAVGTAAAATAQTATGEPPANVQMRIGPLYINPSLSLGNAGTDTNVFNDATNPKSDFTMTLTPATDLWLRLGPSWVQSTISEDLVWYQQYASERSANNTYTVKWIVPLARLTVTPTWTHVNSRERVGYEIDARALHTATSYGAQAELRLLSKTFIGVQGQRTTTDYDPGATFLGVNLSGELNDTDTVGSVALRHQLTPLTSVSISAVLDEDRFELDPLRNSKSREINGSISFDPAALIKGSAMFGYRDFKPDSPDLPAFAGMTMAVNLDYVLLGVTKFDVTAARDVQYSYDINQPYYVQTGLTGTISQQLFGPIDIVARGGLQRLEYRDRIGAAVPVADRLDRVTLYGGGIGYHLGRDTRIGFNVDQTRRQSAVAERAYNGLQYGFAVTYGSGAGL